jgi:hypothetical protein
LAPLHAIPDGHAQMGLHFFLQIAIPPAACHDGSPSGLMMLAMAPESCVQRACSAASCFLPAEVSR